ncbi:hypothetical protein OC842_008040, partial [Tilletia horrida]
PAPASIVEQAIVTESRQQFAFRQLEGLFPVATWFMTGLTQPDAIAAGTGAGGPDIAHNVTSLTYPGRIVELSWDAPGQIQGPYPQRTQTKSNGVPKFAAWFGNLNVTMTPLFNVNLTARRAKTKQPDDVIFPGTGQRVINASSAPGAAAATVQTAQGRPVQVAVPIADPNRVAAELANDSHAVSLDENASPAEKARAALAQ